VEDDSRRTKRAIKQVALRGMELRRSREAFEQSIFGEELAKAAMQQAEQERAALRDTVGGVAHVGKQNATSMFAQPSGDEKVEAFSQKHLCAEDIKLRRLAKDFAVPLPDAEAVKAIFDHYDRDRSGDLNKDEFQNMVTHFLGIKDKFDVPAKRVDDYWLSIDADRSGAVEFKEFLTWYYANIAPMAQLNWSSPTRGVQTGGRPKKKGSKAPPGQANELSWSDARLQEFCSDPTMRRKVAEQRAVPAAVLAR